MKKLWVIAFVFKETITLYWEGWEGRFLSNDMDIDEACCIDDRTYFLTPTLALSNLARNFERACVAAKIDPAGLNIVLVQEENEFEDEEHNFPGAEFRKFTELDEICKKDGSRLKMYHPEFGESPYWFKSMEELEKDLMKFHKLSMNDIVLQIQEL